MQRLSISLIVASALVLGACGEKPTPPSAVSAAAAPLTPPITTPPAVPTPPPVAGTAAPTETAKDSAETNPKGTLSKEEESKSMPMAGHGNNHSSPSLEAAPKK